MTDRRLAAAVPAVLATLVLGAALAPARAELVREERARMGTPVSIQIEAPAVRTEAARKAIDAAYAEIDRLEAILSEWKPDSEISRINAGNGGKPVTVGEETLALILKSIEIGRLTGGAFDVTFLPLGRLWDFRRAQVPAAAEVAAARRLVDYRRIAVDAERHTVALPQPGMAIGLGGIAKGYIVDRVAGALRRQGFTDFVIVAGGDMRADGLTQGRPWRIGIQDPRDPGQMLAWLPVSDLSVNTSGDYERFFIAGGRRYHHIVDPATGWPAEGCRSVTVVTRDTGIGDALSTGLFVLGPERGIALAERLPEVEALIVDSAGAVHATSGFTMEPPAPVEPVD